MNELLQQIEKELEAALSRYKSVKRNIAELKTRLAETRKQQGAAIVGERDAEEIGKEFVTLQTQIGGAEEARLQLLETIRELQERKERELRSIARELADKTKAECLEIVADIYASLVQAAYRLPDLRNMRQEYIIQLTAAGSKDAKEEGRKFSFVLETLHRELPNLLDIFPMSIIADGTLPAPKSVRGKIKA